MNFADSLQFILGAAPVLVLLVVGLGLTLRSGVISSSSGQSAQLVASNFSHTVLITGGCLIVMIVIQHFAGARIALPW